MRRAPINWLQSDRTQKNRTKECRSGWPKGLAAQEALEKLQPSADDIALARRD
jgi:hypothetical protein